MSEGDSDKGLRKLNFLDQSVKIKVDGKIHTGRVYYFCEKMIVLSKANGVF